MVPDEPNRLRASGCDCPVEEAKAEEEEYRRIRNAAQGEEELEREKEEQQEAEDAALEEWLADPEREKEKEAAWEEERKEHLRLIVQKGIRDCECLFCKCSDMVQYSDDY